MSKQGMKRPERTHSEENEPYVPEIHGKAKHGKTHVRPIVAGTSGSSQKVWHNSAYSGEKPVSSTYKDIDNDLALDNLENDIPAADMQDI